MERRPLAMGIPHRRMRGSRIPFGLRRAGSADLQLSPEPSDDDTQLPLCVRLACYAVSLHLARTYDARRVGDSKTSVALDLQQQRSNVGSRIHTDMML